MFRLENKIVPWQKRGRWYEVFLESDGTDIKVTKSDYGTTANINTTDNTFCFEEEMHILDWKMDINADTGTKKWFQNRMRMYESGMIGIELPAADNFDYMTLYVFGYLD